MSANPVVEVNNFLASAKRSNKSRLILGNESAGKSDHMLTSTHRRLNRELARLV